MSEYVYKSGIYWKLPMHEFDSKSELIELFSVLGCKADEYWLEYLDDDEEPLFFIEPDTGFYPLVTENNLILEYIIKSDIFNGDFESAVSTIEIDRLTDIVIRKLDLDAYKIEPVVFSYVWYNGTDEPFPDEIE